MAVGDTKGQCSRAPTDSSSDVSDDPLSDPLSESLSDFAFLIAVSDSVSLRPLEEVSLSDLLSGIPSQDPQSAE